MCVCTAVYALLILLHITHHMCVASGEDMAYEHVHHDPAGVHRGSVGSEVY